MIDSPPTVLPDMLTLHRARISALAESWLQQGAATFEIWEGETLLARWPDNAPPQRTTLSAPIQTTQASIFTPGEVRVAGGPHAPHDKARLEAEADLLSLLARLTIEQESMVADLIEAQDQLLAVYDLTQSTCYHTYYVDLDQLLRCIASEVSRMLKVGGGFMLISEEQACRVVCHPPPEKEPFPPDLLNQLHHCEHDLILTRETPAAASLLTMPPHIENLLFVPIKLRAGTRAGLGLWNKTGGFASPELKLAQAIAEQAGVRIENFLLHQETLEQARLQTEMQLARQVQQRLLPQRPPTITGLDIFADWRPARQASGDFYDFVERPGQPLIFTVGDVSGKGMPAALLTVEILTELRGQARILLDPTPAAMLRCINNTLYDDFTRAEMLATMFLAHYDPACRELRYANAGHAPVLHCPANGAPRLLKAEAPPIGVLPVLVCPNEALFLAPGDIVLVATDGFTETFNENKALFGYERLIALVDSARHKPAAEIARRLFAAIDSFAGRADNHTTHALHHTIDDDQAVIVIKGVESAVETCITHGAMARFDIPAAPDYLNILGESVAAMLAGEPEQTIYAVRLALHELCTNIIVHAYGNTLPQGSQGYRGYRGYISIRMMLVANPRRLITETYDTGRPYDPSRIPEPDLLDEQGRGLHLIRSLLNEVLYHASTDQAWLSRAGQPWQPVQATHPQPGRNYWYLIKHL